MIPDLRIASPCSADWDQMRGDDRVRHCSECNLKVYNFSQMTQPEVESLWMRHEGRVCARIYRRADGTILTKDCPVGLRAIVRRASRIAEVILSAMVSMGFAGVPPVFAKTLPHSASSQPLVQIDHTQSEISLLVTASSGKPIPGAKVMLLNSLGKKISQGTTTADGRFRFSELTPGTYTVTVRAHGLSRYSGLVDLRVENSGSWKDPYRFGSQPLMGDVVAVPPPGK